MNPEQQRLVQELKRTSHTEESALWKRIAGDLEKSRKNKRVVNLSRINRYTQADETVIVPGKVLGAGSLDHKVHVAAFSFSRTAKETIVKQKGSALSIPELIKQNPKGKNVRIIG
jgi:large subunit ribosomal protein L18e